jgi:2-dehydro-3-deoxygluconokinase
VCVVEQPNPVVCFGEAMLRQSQDDSGDTKITPGGAEYNVACALATLGTSVKWITSLPADESAELITLPAIESGVKLTIITSEHPVGEYEVVKEDKTVLYNRANSAFSHLKSGDIDWRQEISGARWLVTSGITPLLGKGPLANWATAMTFAELDGTLVALDLNHRPALGTFEELWNEVEPRLRQVHLLVLSPENLLTLTGHNSPEMLVELRAKWNIPYLACTWKEEHQGVQTRWSAVAHSRGFSTTLENYVTHTPVEALGGGDAWLAGFIDALLEGLNLGDCCRRGDILAALTQRTFGDLGNVGRDELSRWESIEGAVDLLQDG